MQPISENDSDLVGQIEAVGQRIAEVRQNIGRVIFGQEEVINETLITLLAGGHALLIGVPGLAKTRLVATLGTVLGLEDKRVQFTPDLMPADILGSEVLEESDSGRRSFRFLPGPVFCQLLMADEINRASPRTQSALLQAMQENAVSIAGQRHPLPSPFHVLATQNPLEQEGTYPLPEAQLDRFLMRVHLGYPTNTDEVLMMDSQQVTHPVDSLQQVTDASEIIQTQQAVKEIYVDPLIKQYIVGLVDMTRQHESVYLGASPRGSLALYRTSQAQAMLDGRDYVIPDDVKSLAYATLGHRVIVSPSARVKSVTAADIILGCLERVPVPGARARGGQPT